MTAGAEADLRSAVRWYAQHNPRAARSFAAAVMRAAEELALDAERYSFSREAENQIRPLRRVLVGRKVKWRLYSEIVDDTVRVVHLRHGARDGWTG